MSGSPFDVPRARIRLGLVLRNSAGNTGGGETWPYWRISSDLFLHFEMLNQAK
jgi:hypothetical protein